jgi:hypothetical protein
MATCKKNILLLLDGILDAHLREHKLDQMKDLAMETKIARLVVQHFPLHLKLLDRYQSRREVDQEVRPHKVASISLTTHPDQQERLLASKKPINISTRSLTSTTHSKEWRLF